jgi:hypothetical protein
MVTTEIACGGYINAARFYTGTYIGYASFSGKKQVEKIKILANFPRKNSFWHLSKTSKLN